MFHKNTPSVSSSSAAVVYGPSNIAGTQVSKFSFPKEVGGISDHIKKHEGGEFLGAAIADIETITVQEMAQSMRNLSSSNEDSTTVVLPEVSLDLFKPITKHNFGKVVERLAVGKEHGEMSFKNKFFDPKYKYLCVRKVVGYFVPMTSSTADKFGCVVLLKNKAFREDNQEICRVILDSSVSCSFFMSMDFFINFSDLDKLSLEVHCNQNVVNQGTQWAAMKLSITCKQASFPKPLNIFPSQVQIYPPYSLLFPITRDPRIFNARIVQEDLQPIAQMYLDNEISYVRETADQKSKKSKIRYQGTRFGTKKQASVGSDSAGDVDETTKILLKGKNKALEDKREEGLKNARNSQAASFGLVKPAPVFKPTPVRFDPNIALTPILKNAVSATPQIVNQMESLGLNTEDAIPVVTQTNEVSYSSFQDKKGNTIPVDEVIASVAAFPTDELDDKGMPAIVEVSEYLGSEGSEIGVSKSLGSEEEEEEIVVDKGKQKEIPKGFEMTKFFNNEPDRPI